MTAKTQYIVESKELHLLDLIRRVPEELLTQYDPLVLASLRMQLEARGLKEGDYELGEIYEMDEDEHGWFHLIDVTVGDVTLPARITISLDELETILHFGDRMASFAAEAVALLAGPDETVHVGEVEADGNIDLVIADGAGETIWWRRAAASELEVLRVVAAELQWRWSRAV